MSALAQIKADAIEARKAKSLKAKVLVTLLGEIETKTKTLPSDKQHTYTTKNKIKSPIKMQDIKTDIED